MLAAMTPEEFQEAWASAHLDPIADGWRQTGEICAAITNAIMVSNASQPLRPDQLVAWEQFVPQLNCLQDQSQPRQDGTMPINSAVAKQMCGY